MGINTKNQNRKNIRKMYLEMSQVCYNLRNSESCQFINIQANLNEAQVICQPSN